MPQSKRDARDRHRRRCFIVTGNGAACGCGTATVRAPLRHLHLELPLSPMTINTMHDKLIWNSPKLGAAQQKHPDAHQSRSRPAGLAGGRHENAEHITTEKGLDVSDLNPKVKP